jgi:general secretion pathway protein G
MKQRNDNSRRARQESGFSILEIMIVIALIALLAAVVAPNVIGLFSSGQQDVARTEIKMFETGLKLFYRNCGRYPSTAEGLEALVTPVQSCSKWKKVLDADEIKKDPWDRPYRYTSPGVRSGKEYEIVSTGQNAEDESDDITSFGDMAAAG